MAAALPASDPPRIGCRRLSLSGTSLSVVEAGSGDPVVLLHGFGDSAATWWHVVPALARRHHVVAPDLPGFGASGPPPDGPFVDGLAEVVDRLVRRLVGERPAALVGNSMGGTVALRLALRTPERVSRLVLVGAAGLSRGVPRWWQLLNVQLRPLRGVVGAALGRTPGPLLQSVAERAYVRLVFSHPWAADADSVRRFVRHYRSGVRVDAMLRLGGRFVAELASLRLVEEAAVDLSVPTLLVWGRQDRLVPPSEAARLAAATARARLVVIEDCGHCPQVERPAEFLAVVDPFLRGRPVRRNGARVVTADRLLR